MQRYATTPGVEMAYTLNTVTEGHELLLASEKCSQLLGVFSPWSILLRKSRGIYGQVSTEMQQAHRPK